MKKIKVVHLCSSLEGGAGLCATRIIRSTNLLGIENHVLVKDGNTNDYVDVIEIKRSKNKVIYFFQKLIHHFHLWPKACRLNYKIEKAIHNHDIFGYFTSPLTEYRISNHPWISEADIIHIHWVGRFLDYPSFFNDINKPIVWTLHDENPGLGGFHYKLWKEKSTSKGQQIDNDLALIKKKAYNHVKSMHIVAISTMMKDFINNNNLLQNYPCTLIHNGIEENLFTPIDKTTARNALRISTDKVVFMFIAYTIYEDRKGLKDLLKALEVLNLPNITLICIGQYITKPQTTFEVLCEGLITNPRLLSLYYSAADFFIMPSYQEAFAQTPMEAMACGTPVISYPCSGANDLIKPFNGIVCSDFTVEALIDGIKKAINKQYDCDEIRKYVVENFSYRKIAKQYMQLYENILN